MQVKRRGGTQLGVLVAVVLAGCAGPAVTSSPPVTSSPSLSAPSSVSSPAAAPQAGLASCPAPQAAASLPTFARTDLSPDDLLAVPDGSLWVTDPVGGAVEHLAADGAVLAGFADPLAPEGLVASGSSIVMAEQGPNRVVVFSPPATARTTVLTLPARGGADGLDGIGVDASGHLLLPDSPHGTLLRAATDGSQVVTLATGLGRDVAAATGPDGAIYVAVEGAHGLWRVPAAGGPAVALTALAQLDDVVAVGSLIYATLLVAGEVVAIDPATAAFRVLATGFAASSAQGLALLAGGRLAVADSAAHVISTLPVCAA